MFEGLFDEEAAEYDSKESTGGSQRVPRPPSPRNNTGLCGLSNLGATCYLNSLLQTLHFTPEFREELFKLGEDELGVFSGEVGADNSMVRVIPVQLQKLFASLLLLNQQSCSVDALTSSFGWSNSEEFQQHDVQELNRILFSAIESSLLGTSGEQLIAKLYHGISVQQIICQSCGRVSEREEGYLDLPVALSSGPNLEAVLKESYIEQELLEGANQYCCEECDKLVDAKRVCKLRKLPQILTFALLRFLYDFEKGERYKDTSKFKFPTELDMSPYCEMGALQGGTESNPPQEGTETNLPQGGTMYELYSVVIHSGSTHSGHYTAYIKDVDGLGTWISPDEDVIQLPPDPATGSVDLLDFDNPADLMVELLKQCGGSASVSKLTKALQEKTGVTWNKRFKKQFGPIAKFLQSCPDVFSVSETNMVSLCQLQPTPSSSGREGRGSTSETPPNPLMVRVGVATEGGGVAEGGALSDGIKLTQDGNHDDTPDGSGVDGQGKKKTSKASRKVSTPSPGQCWFEFNDTHVSPILSKQIERMFQGKQSAYMLFYRRKAMQRPREAMGNKLFGVPERFQIEVAEANAALDQERHQYDIAINTVQLTLLFSMECVVENGAIQRVDQDSEPCLLSIDRRRSIGELKEAIDETFSGLYDPDNLVIHTARTLPSGLHLYDCVSGDDEAVIADVGIANNSQLFVWDGDCVGGELVEVGRSCEPILLHVTYPCDDGEGELVRGYPKNFTLGEMRAFLAQLLEIQAGQVSISHVKLSGRDGSPSIFVLPPSKDATALEGLKLQDGDKLAVEKHVKKGVKSLAHFVADKHSKMLQLIIENRLMPPPDSSGLYPVYPVELGKDELVSTLKTTALSTATSATLTDPDIECRLRGEDDATGMGPPLYETQTLTEAGLVPGQRVILEPGPAPLSNQVALRCMMGGELQRVSGDVCEVILERSATVRECRCAVVEAIGLSGVDWHLRRTNWCGEATEVLEDEESTLDQEKIKSNDLLLIEEGRLPPKGFIRLQVFLYSPHSGGAGLQEIEGVELPTEVPLHLVPPTLCYPRVFGELTDIGNLEISKEATVEELKLMILTLPALEQADIPLPGFLRVRELVNGRPGKLFKLHSHTMRRLKLTSGSKVCCTVLPREEILTTTVLVFNVCVRIPGERRYGPPTEVIYDTAQSTSPYALRSHISQLLEIQLDRLRLAKHKLETFEWIRIQDSYQADSKRGRKKGQGVKVNIRNSPIMLKDGDTIGVKDLQYDPDDSDNFSTPLDDQGKAILTAVQEEKRQRRKAKGSTDVWAAGHSKAKQRRQEVGIRIFVPDYRAKTKGDEQTTL